MKQRLHEIALGDEMERAIGAALVLWQLSEPKTMHRILDFVLTSTDEQRGRIFQTLGCRLKFSTSDCQLDLEGLSERASEVGPLLLSALRSEEPGVVAACVDLCGSLRPTGWEMALVECIATEGGMTPDSAAQVLAGFRIERGDETAHAQFSA